MLAIILLQVGCIQDLSIPDDEVQNMNYSKTKLPLPVLGLGGGYTQAFGGNITMPAVIYGMDKVARNATGIVVPNSGHWIPEEQQKFLSEQLTHPMNLLPFNFLTNHYNLTQFQRTLRLNLHLKPICEFNISKEQSTNRCIPFLSLSLVFLRLGFLLTSRCNFSNRIGIN